MSKRKPHDSVADQAFRHILVRRLPPPPGEREPSDEELLRLIEGSISSEQRVCLEQRLRECPLSADRMEIIRAALREAGVILLEVEGEKG